MRIPVKRVGRRNSPPPIAAEYPKLLYHVTTGHMRKVASAEEQQALGPDWGSPQPDVKFQHPTLIDESVNIPSPTFPEPPKDIDMSSLEYPKAMYHPVTKEFFIARTPDEEAAQKEFWGIAPEPEELPNPLASKPVEPVAPEAEEPKA